MCFTLDKGPRVSVKSITNRFLAHIHAILTKVKGVKNREIKDRHKTCGGRFFMTVCRENIIIPEGKSSFKCQPFKCHLPMDFIKNICPHKVAINISNYFFVRTRTLFQGLCKLRNVKSDGQGHIAGPECNMKVRILSQKDEGQAKKSYNTLKEQR